MRVEREALKNSEKPIIASVFINRINRNMRLQSDPTVIYALTKGKTKLKKECDRQLTELKETCDHLNNTSMGDAHDYEVLSEKMANDSETFVGIISDLESQVKSLESENNNLKCVLTTEGIGKHKYEQILKILAVRSLAASFPF